jgi:hypothetical protein
MGFGGGGGGSPAPPAPPAPPPPPPNLGGVTAQKVAQSLRDRYLNSSGYSSTIATSSQGLTKPETTAPRTLLGG